MEQWRERLSMLPSHMRGAMERYVEDGIPGGSFLDAVLCNDLKGAASRADATNKHALLTYAEYMVWYLPGHCHGSPEAVQKWVEVGGLNGLRAKEQQQQKERDNAEYL